MLAICVNDWRKLVRKTTCVDEYDVKSIEIKRKDSECRHVFDLSRCDQVTTTPTVNAKAFDLCGPSEITTRRNK